MRRRASMHLHCPAPPAARPAPADTALCQGLLTAPTSHTQPRDVHKPNGECKAHKLALVGEWESPAVLLGLQQPSHPWDSHAPNPYDQELRALGASPARL